MNKFAKTIYETALLMILILIFTRLGGSDLGPSVPEFWPILCGVILVTFFSNFSIKS